MFSQKFISTNDKLVIGSMSIADSSAIVYRYYF